MRRKKTNCCNEVGTARAEGYTKEGDSCEIGTSGQYASYVLIPRIAAYGCLRPALENDTFTFFQLNYLQFEPSLSYETMQGSAAVSYVYLRR